MKKVRKDGKGLVLHKGETYLRNKKLYCFSYTDVFGKRKFLYANSLIDLREKEEDGFAASPGHRDAPRSTGMTGLLKGSRYAVARAGWPAPHSSSCHAEIS